MNFFVQLIFSKFISLDLPGHLEAVWSWVEACGSVVVVEQFTTILAKALHLGLPLSQHFTYDLMKKGIGAGSRDMVPERGYGRPPLPCINQRSRGSRKWKGKARQLQLMEENNHRKRGSYRTTYMNVQQYRSRRGQTALGRNQN